LRVEKLRVSFGAQAAVEDVGFDLHAGETLCVVGESGSGKSVSALALMRLVEFDGGQIKGGRLLFDCGATAPEHLERADQARMRRLRGNQIAMVFQEPMTALNPVFTIGRQVGEALRLHKYMGRRAARARTLELLREVRLPEPERRIDQYPHELSGGMRQRVVIAMALACDPKLLVADEPTTALDVTSQAEILALIDRLKRKTGAAVLFITHDMAVVAQMADRVAVMRDGRVVEEGGVTDLFARPQHPYTRSLLAAVPRLGAMRGQRYPQPMALPGGPKPAEVVGSDRPLLQVEGLTTRFDLRGGVMRRRIARVHAVEDVSFTLNAGRTLALVGESGCGKSSLGRSILRLTEPAAGHIRLDGTDITSLTQRALRAARRDMQMIFQDPYGSLDPQLQLADQVAEPLWNFKWGSAAQIEDRVNLLFDRVGLPRSAQRRFPHELSGGQRQRVAIARALALEPKLIVADEAVSALDVSVQAQILNLLMELQAEMGLSYLFISHDMAVVERVSHDVAVMYLGRIVERGPRACVFENPQHPYTRKLLGAVPVPDPAQRLEREPNHTPVPSPIHPLDYTPPPSDYRQVGEGHVVLAAPRWDMV
jgi:peptide/nickel transport system ATP-binding protein/glutathione transport system ATP-binding protein